MVLAKIFWDLYYFFIYILSFRFPECLHVPGRHLDHIRTRRSDRLHEAVQAETVQPSHATPTTSDVHLPIPLAILDQRLAPDNIDDLRRRLPIVHDGLAESQQPALGGTVQPPREPLLHLRLPRGAGH